MSHVITSVATGGTLTVAPSTDAEINVIVNNGLANVAGVKIELPTSPVDGQKVKVSGTGGIAVSSVVSLDGSVVVPHYGQSGTGAGYSGGWTIIYDAASHGWYPGV